MAKRIMEEFSISEISAVDRPAQKGAKMTIMKRDFSTEDREKLAEEGKAMPDGSFPIVTTADMKNAIESYGRAADKEAAKKHIIRRARALDAIDQLPDDWEVKKLGDAVEIITKRWIDPADGAKPFSVFLESRMDNKRYFDVMEEVGPLISALDGSLHSIAGDATMASEAKQLAMREGVEEFLTAIRSKWPKVEEEIAEAFTDLDKGSNAGDPAGDHIGKKEHPMSDEAKTVADLTKQVADLTKRLEEADTISKMSAAERGHLESLDDKAKKDFMAMSPEDRAKAVSKADEADAVVYKSADGTEFRKSDDPRMVAMAKRADAAEEVAKAERDARELSDLKKRASDDFGHLPGTVAAKAGVLKAMGTMDEEVRKSLETILAAGEKLAKAGFTMAGANGGSNDETSAQGKLEKRAKDIQKAETSLSYEQAYDKAAQENPALYQEVIEGAQ